MLGYVVVTLILLGFLYFVYQKFQRLRHPKVAVVEIFGEVLACEYSQLTVTLQTKAGELHLTGNKEQLKNLGIGMRGLVSFQREKLIDFMPYESK